MPDPDRKTISATEAPALFNASPYLTRWMLYHKFKSGMDTETPSDERMWWGKEMQPSIARRVAMDKKLEVTPNEHETYVRRGPIGCTRDAVILCPDRGPGALEIKCVFDYQTWMTNWRGGDAPPRHNEIQLQSQMYVGDGTTPYRWGILAVWVCAALYYFERKPIANLQASMHSEAVQFFADVAEGNEPDPFGAAVEAPFLAAMFPTRPESILDLSDDPAGIKAAEDLSMFKTHKELADGSGRVTEQMRLKLLALAKDYEFVKLAFGCSYRIKKSGKGRSVVPYIPDRPTAAPPSTSLPILAAG